MNTRPWCLVVDPEEDTLAMAATAISAAVAKKQAPEFRITQARNLAEARKAVADNGLAECGLMTMRSRIPRSESDRAFSADIDSAMEFIKEQKQSSPELPVIVYSENPGERFGGFLSAFNKTALLATDVNWRNSLTEMAAALFTAQAPRNTLELDIFLNGTGQQWFIKCKGAYTFESFGPLSITGSQIDSLAQNSEYLGRSVETLKTGKDRKRWQSDLSKLGATLTSAIFVDSRPNDDFSSKFSKHRGKIGDDRCIRMRFTVDQKSHPILLEAIMEGNDHWMLKAPVFRRFKADASVFPLFKDYASRSGSINCLIIVADPRAGALADDVSFAPLPGLESEAERIQQALDTAPGVNLVRCVFLSKERDHLKEKVLAILGEQRWHLVHFAGHSTVGKTGPGLVLSPERGGILPVSDVVRRLPWTQLLFINSCNSGDGDTVLRAAQNQIPAVLGYRWKIRDKEAAHFAEAFYKHLFREESDSYKYLEYAFLAARLALYKQYPMQPAWAAPALVMQLVQAEAGPRVLFA